MRNEIIEADVRSHYMDKVSLMYRHAAVTAGLFVCLFYAQNTLQHTVTSQLDNKA